ncbi:MAG TPA: CotH kinase family protein [Bacteroidales bacterium]|mgnify:CR=1 FL=1|nr:CotH kinase family protein [Bacteroidales bacterium]HPS15856.1 CotH kinase family protein [Bacteroidales bacterium]
MKIKLLLTISIFIISVFSLRSQVVINEYSCSNLNQFVDNNGEYEDWIELYNTSATAVNLAGYYLSDDSIENLKWKIPSGISIAANGFLRFWASGRDMVSGTNYHTNFKLTQTKNNNEFITLSNSSGVIIDQKEIKQRTQVGHSIGRSTNGALTWSVFTTPTPNASNNTSTPFDDYASKPQENLTAGFYANPVTVTLLNDEPNSTVYYTLDGSQPSASSTVYSGPITISTTKVLKAITISSDPAILPSFIIYDTYFINVSHTTVVVSVAGEQVDDLANGNGNLVPVGTIEYFNLNKERKAKTMGDFNKHGQDSWANSQRSIDFVARDEMGYNSAVKQKLMTYSDRDSYQRFILRAAGDDNYPADHNSANAGSAHVRDAYVHMVAKQGGLDLDVRMSEKAILYINGQYWGVYDIRERPDDHDFCDYYYGQDKYHLQYLLYWGGRWAEYGGNQAMTDWDTFYDYIMSLNMANPTNYQYVTERLDVKSLVDYVLVNMFSVCSDWLNWNTGWWRGMDSTGGHLKWGYILWDNDATFGHYINYTGIPNTNPDADPCDPESLSGDSDPEGHIALLLKLRENPDFNQYYISRQIDLWNTVFGCENMLSKLDSVVAIIDPEMTQHAARWSGTYTEWKNNVQLLRDFITQRCVDLTSGFIDCYSLTGPYNLTVDADPAIGGNVKINSLLINQYPWTGNYFGGMENKLQVLPALGYEFINWTSDYTAMVPGATADSISVTLTTADTITAHFLYTDVPELPENNPSISAYPTVFSNSTVIDFNLPEESKVSMKLYTLQGREISTIINTDKVLQNGHYEYQINLSNTSLPAGMYVVDFVAGKYRKCIKLIYSPQ